MYLPKSIRSGLAALALASVAATAAPALAQDDSAERIKKLEAEVRALQRKVFPGGDGRFFEPEITAPGSTASGPANGASTPPSTTAVTDILVRLDALEAQLQRLTAQVEENGNSLREFDTRLAALEVTTQAAQNAETGEPLATNSGVSPAVTTSPAAPAGVTATPANVTTSPTAVAATPAGPSAERLAAVQEIAKPQTDDAGDDEYSYGFRLWNAGFYPEAQQQLALFLEKYPSHSRATFGRNLLGRAYLDDGNPREAAGWFLKNYQADKGSARAPDSLLYLAESMIALNDTSRACIALAEFGETYTALASGRLQDQYERNRARVTCN